MPIKTSKVIHAQADVCLYVFINLYKLQSSLLSWVIWEACILDSSNQHTCRSRIFSRITAAASERAACTCRAALNHSWHIAKAPETLPTVLENVPAIQSIQLAESDAPASHSYMFKKYLSKLSATAPSISYCTQTCGKGSSLAFCAWSRRLCPCPKNHIQLINTTT